MTELRIRVKDKIKDFLEEIKEERGFSINFQVNFAIFKYLILDVRVPYWKLDDRPDPHYETINKMPDEAVELNKFYDGDSCEIPISQFQKDVEEFQEELNYRVDKRGDKC